MLTVKICLQSSACHTRGTETTLTHYHSRSCTMLLRRWYLCLDSLMDVQGNANQVAGNEIQIVILKHLMFFSYPCCVNILTVSLYSPRQCSIWKTLGKRESRIFLVSHSKWSDTTARGFSNNSICRYGMDAAWIVCIVSPRSSQAMIKLSVCPCRN